MQPEKVNGWYIWQDAGDEWVAADIDEHGNYRDQWTFPTRGHARIFAITTVLPSRIDLLHEAERPARGHDA